MHKKILFTIIFVINISLFLAQPQNYDTQRNQQGYARGNPRNSDKRDYMYQHFDRPNDRTEVINIGNGYNRENHVIIDSRPNGRESPGYNSNQGSTFTGGREYAGQGRSKVYSTDQLTSRFGSDNSETYQYTRLETPGTGITSINNIGNGINNRNTVVIRQHDKTPGSSITIVSPNVNGGRQTIDTRYRPANIPGNNYQSQVYRNQEPQYTRTFNNIGRGNNHNIISVNGEVISTDSDGVSFTTVNSNRPSKAGNSKSNYDKFISFFTTMYGWFKSVAF